MTHVHKSYVELQIPKWAMQKKKTTNKANIDMNPTLQISQ